MIKKNLTHKKGLSKLRQRYSLLLIALLFIVSMTIPPVIAQVSTPNPVIQAQQNARYLAEKAKEKYDKNNFSEARELWQQTAEAFANSGERLNQAMALSNLSLTYQQLGQWEEADTEIQESLNILNAAPENSRVLAQTLDIQGNLQIETGKSVDALETWQKAANIYEKRGELEALEQNNLNQVQAMQDLGLYLSACNTLLELLGTPFKDLTCPPLEQKIPEKQQIPGEKTSEILTAKQLNEKVQEIQKISLSLLKVQELRSLGDVLRVLGQQEQSQAILTNSLGLAQKLDSSKNITEISSEIGAIYLSIGRLAHSLTTEEAEIIPDKREENQDQALENYRQAIAISPDLITQQQARLNQLSLLIQINQWSEAASLCQEILTEFDKLSPSHSNVFAQINFAHILIELLDRDKPQPPSNLEFPGVSELDRILANATENAQTLGDKRAEAYALGNRGRLYELTGELSTAEQYTRQAISLISTLDAPDIAYQYFWQLGRIQNRQEDLERAIAAYTKAYNALQYLRSDIATINPELQFSFRDEVEPVYRELVELDFKYYNQKKAENKEESTAKLIQARDVIESLQIAQLNNFFREACIEGSPQQIDKIDSNAAVIYTIVLPDKLGILLSLPNKSPTLYQTHVTEKEIKKTVRDIGSFLESRGGITVENALPDCQKAYDWLIRPLEAELAELDKNLDKNKVPTISFVLDGYLRSIPMSILHDRNKNKYLVQKYALGLTPGLQLLDPKPLTEIKLKAIAAGLSDKRDNFPPLPGVEAELQAISEMGLVDRDRSLLNKNFSKKALKQNIVNSGDPIIHLATHAKFSPKVEDTFILTGIDQIYIKDLDELLRDDTFKRKNAIELLVLSACQTATEDSRATLGLAGVAVKSGARSTLATLWRVADKSTAMIMKQFYLQLKQAGTTRINKAEALRQAQLTIMNNKNFSHPYYWAPFILIGNWQ